MAKFLSVVVKTDDIDAAQSDGQVPPALLTTAEKLGHREKPAGFRRHGDDALSNGRV